MENPIVIGTGSSGNAVLINSAILVDCGLPWKKIEPYSKQIKLVLLTHEHGDHFKVSTVRTLHARRPTVKWACCHWMIPLLLNAGVSKKSIFILNPHDKEHALLFPGIATVRAEAIPHNVQNCCWHILFPDSGIKVFYATDTSSLSCVTAKNYNLYCVEANYEEAEMLERIERKRAVGVYSYELEAMRNHLSLQQAESWLAENAGPQSEYLFLHQHKDKF